MQTQGNKKREHFVDCVARERTVAMEFLLLGLSSIGEGKRPNP